MWIAVISTGVMTIERGTSVLQPAVLTRTDILNAIEQPNKLVMSYPDTFYGGKMGKVTRFMDKGIKFAKKHRGAIVAVGKYVGQHPAFNGGSRSGGALIGGALMSKEMLKKRAFDDYVEEDEY